MSGQFFRVTFTGDDRADDLHAMKDVARMIRRHFDGIIAWAQTRQTNGVRRPLF